MENLRTEEEQIAALKNWWKENGNSLLIGIGAALFILFGWKAYQNSVIDGKTEASLLYQQLITSVAQPGIEADDTSSVSYLAGELKENFSDTEYGIYAALFLAKEAVNADELESAITELEWVKQNTEDARLHSIVNGRIARVLSAQGKHDDALALLDTTDPVFAASYLEITGDIKKRQGDAEGAIEAYKEAFQLVKETPQVQPLLGVKLSDLGVNPESL